MSRIGSKKVSIALVDGLEGQAEAFCKAFLNEFEKQSTINVRHIFSGREERLEGSDLVFVFPNTWEDACSTYQEKWATKAREAGVKLFIPFEFGNPLGHQTGDPPIIDAIHKLLAHCQSIDLDVCRVHVGPAMDVILPGILSIDLDTNNAQVVGKGDTPISFVTTADVAHVVAETIIAKDTLDHLRGSAIKVRGQPQSYNQVLKLVAALGDRPVHSVHRDVEEVKRSLPRDIGPPQFLDWLMVAWEEGRAFVRESAEVKEFSFETVAEVLKTNMAREKK